jgi:hypothetical protein
LNLAIGLDAISGVDVEMWSVFFSGKQWRFATIFNRSFSFRECTPDDGSWCSLSSGNDMHRFSANVNYQSTKKI